MMRRESIALGLSLMAVVASAAPPAESWVEPETGMAFVWVAGGCFQMGTDEHVPLRGDTLWNHLGPDRNLALDEQPRHEVCVDGFWMSLHETRVSEWQSLMGGLVQEGVDPARPIAAITWHEARAFAQKMTERTGGQSRFRLPTEAEWEYACRAGADDEEIPRGSEAIDRAWYNRNENRDPRPRPVGQLEPNPFGLYDMLGNVWEWTEDAYLADAYASHALYNPRVEAPSDSRVIRGGSHRSEPEHIRCGRRGHYSADARLRTVGFRLIRTE